jgi:hypothetical protein
VALDRLIFVRRRSPDWERLAEDHESGTAIDPARYVRVNVTGFPGDLVARVGMWNRTFPVSFFRCRQGLKEISERALRQVENAVVMSDDRLHEVLAMTRDARSMLFFFDDDDLFAPDLFARLSTVEFGRCDVAVFPLIRLGEHVYTYVRDDEPARVTVGRREAFRFRFQTNNYGVSSSVALSEHLVHLNDHVAASTYADRRNLSDRYFDILIGATNKTPCSAAVIRGLPTDERAYRALVHRYVESLARLTLPPEAAWLTKPVDDAVALFAEVTGRVPGRGGSARTAGRPASA